MKEVVITAAELAALPEYSCTLPTGTSRGKRWRRNTHIVGISLPRDKPGPAEWAIGEYVDRPDVPEGEVGIDWAWAVKAPGIPWRGDAPAFGDTPT